MGFLYLDVCGEQFMYSLDRKQLSAEHDYMYFLIALEKGQQFKK